jgi:hypothetical protein
VPRLIVDIVPVGDKEKSERLPNSYSLIYNLHRVDLQHATRRYFRRDKEKRELVWDASHSAVVSVTLSDVVHTDCSFLLDRMAWGLFN